MITQNHLRILAAATLFALSLLSVPVFQVPVHAQWNTDRASCEKAGFVWSDTKGCADQNCTNPANGQLYPPGGITNRIVNGKLVQYMCNGWTGQFDQVGGLTAPTSSPLAPQPLGNAPLTPSTPGRLAPLPLGSAVTR